MESNNNRVCVEAYDNYNEVSSGVICSDAYKLDKTAPTVGSINIAGTKGSNDWYTTSVTITPVDGLDSLSGHDTTVADVTSITSNTNGQDITVTTTDSAGNTSTTTYTIKVDKTVPNVSIVSTVGNNIKFTATVTPSSTYTYEWYKDNAISTRLTLTSE